MSIARDMRESIVMLLDLKAPADALTAYYALYHSEAKTTLHLAVNGGDLGGFVAICQTPFELFTPMVVLRSHSESQAVSLLQAHLAPGHGYSFAVREGDTSPLRRTCRTWDESHELIYTLDPGEFRPQKRPGVRRRDFPDGRLRFEILRERQVVSRAGTNWESPHFAEIGVDTSEGYRRQGLGKAVVSACTEALLARGITPVYMVDERNVASRRLCEALGYRHHGHREFACRGILR